MPPSENRRHGLSQKARWRRLVKKRNKKENKKEGDENKTPLFQGLIYFSKKKGDLSPKKGDLSPVLSPTRNKKENKQEGRVREGEGKGIYSRYIPCAV